MGDGGTCVYSVAIRNGSPLKGAKTLWSISSTGGRQPVKQNPHKSWQVTSQIWNKGQLLYLPATSSREVITVQGNRESKSHCPFRQSQLVNNMQFIDLVHLWDKLTGKGGHDKRQVIPLTSAARANLWLCPSSANRIAYWPASVKSYSGHNNKMMFIIPNSLVLTIPFLL